MNRPTLYQRVLGAEFGRLPAVLQQFHSLPRGGKAAGLVTVNGGDGYLRGVLGRVLRLPPPGRDVPVRLEVVPQGDRELWVRHFGEERLTTLQWQEGAFLVESAGPLRLVFRLSADEAGMTFHFQHNRLGPLRLPPFTALRVEATAQGEQDRWRIRVRIDAPPPLGRLTDYEGHIMPALPMPPC